MLEREFGGKGKAVNDEEHVIGSVDSKGKLITEGSKKRLAIRWLEVLLALLAGGSSIYAGLVRDVHIVDSRIGSLNLFY